MADGNIFTNSLSQLGAWLQSQLAQPQGLGANAPTFTPGQGQVTQPGGPAPAGAAPAVATPSTPLPTTTAPPAIPAPTNLQVSGGTGGGQPGSAAAVAATPPSNFPVPGSPNVAIKQPANFSPNVAQGTGAGARPATAQAGAQQQTPAQQAFGSAMSGISDALSKAAGAIAQTPTMPTPIQSGPFPSISQVSPTLIGRRTQQPIV